jgi:hypothetical protein
MDAPIGQDVQVNDVQGNDVLGDVVADVQTHDVVDAGGPDVDSSAAIPPFLTSLATAFCAKVKACCANEMPTGTTFDTNGCIAVNTPVGYQGTALGMADIQEAGVPLKFDPAKAAACLADINAIDCTANALTTAQQIAILTDCTDAISGEYSAGTPCVASIECGSGMFCKTPAPGTLGPDGGPVAGTCTALRGAGGPCGDFGDISQGGPNGYDYGLSEEACSYRRTGNTQLACYNYLLDGTGDIDGGPAAWTCQPAGQATALCNVNQDCTTMLCDPGAPGYPYYGADGGLVAAGGTNFKCANSMPFAYPNACLPFAK